MVAATRRHETLSKELPPKAIHQRCQQIRSEWTCEQRAWRATMAAEKLANLLPWIIDPKHFA